MKLMFVSPIVSRRYASDWERVRQALTITVSSLTRQLNSDWMLMVVGEEMPQLPPELDRHVVFVKADLDIDNPKSRGRREVDKERKLYCGYTQLKQYSPEYVMPLDYDDLVSVKLVEYVHQNPSLDGFLLKRGYIYMDGSQRYYYSRNLYQRTGSNLIVRYSPNRFPTELSDFNPPPVGYRDCPFVASHLKDPLAVFSALGLKSGIVPFPAVVWRRNDLSISNAFASSTSTPNAASVSTVRSSWNNLQAFVKRMVLTRKITDEFCEEFGCRRGEGLG